jgi:vesicular inhibitory amino acid transporter
MAVIGLLMFGDDIAEEITANVFLTRGYPKVLSLALILFVAIIPLTKIPLK